MDQSVSTKKEMTLFDLIASWLKFYGRDIRPGFIFHVDYGFGGLIRCSHCEIFIAFINKDSLTFRLDGPDYEKVFAADCEFFPILAKYLKAHIC